jgi:NADH:ubiquinone oxidoreductase subunit E
LKRVAVLCDVTASQIIEEIKRLPSKQKAEVLSALLRSQTEKGMLTPEQLVALADEMVAAKDPDEADRLQKQILAGFYGR